MNKWRRRWRYGMVLLGSCWISLGGLPKAPAEETPALGVIDMGRLFNEYNEYQQANREYQEYHQKLVSQYQARLNLRKQHAMLTSDEYGELETLLLKGNDLNEADKKRVQELQNTTPRLREELARLQTKPDLSEAEKARKKELLDKQSAGLQELEERTKEFDRLIQEKLRERDAEVSAALRTKIDDMIAHVAQEMQLAMVFNKDSVLFGGVDITDQVVKRLNEENPVPIGSGGQEQKETGTPRKQ